MALENIKNILTELGLSDTEARVYLGMIELGPSSVQNIAKKARISRTAAYEIIGSLQHKGIASTYQKGKKKLFSAEDPGKLKEYFKNKMDSMKDQLGDLSRMIPELRVLQAEERPIVRFYSGNDGIRSAFRDVEEVNTKELLEFSNASAVSDTLDLEMLAGLRSATYWQKLPIKCLHQGELRWKPKATSEIRDFPEKFGIHSANIWIYKNRVSFVNIRGDAEVVIIESQVFADAMRAMFVAGWSTAKPAKYIAPNAGS